MNGLLTRFLEKKKYLTFTALGFDNLVLIVSLRTRCVKRLSDRMTRASRTLSDCCLARVLLDCAILRTFYCEFPRVYFPIEICKTKLYAKILRPVFMDCILTYNSDMREAPSKEFSSIPVIWLRLKSNFNKFGNLPNRPSEFIRPSSLSCNNLRV